MSGDKELDNMLTEFNEIDEIEQEEFDREEQEIDKQEEQTKEVNEMEQVNPLERPDEKMKICKKCGTVKAMEKFFKDKYNKKDGRMNVCKVCDNEYQKEWRERKKKKENKVSEIDKSEVYGYVC